MADNFGFVPDDDKSGNAFGFELSPEEQEKVTAYTQAQQPSEAQSLLEGAQQGLTFGFADELGGVMGAGMEAASSLANQGRLPPANELEALYNEYRDANRARYKRSEETNPGYFTAGAIGGGALVPAGAIGKLGKAGLEAKMATTPAQAVANLSNKATIAQKIASGAKVGMAAGALQGAGSSEVPIMSGEFARDVGVGTVGGGVVGGGLPVVGAAAKGTYDLAKTMGAPMITGFKQGMRGIDLLGDDAERNIQSEIAHYGQGLTDEIQGTLNTLGKQKNDIIKEATDSGVQIDPQKLDEFINRRLATDSKSNLPEVARELEQFREMLRTAKEGPMVERDTRVFYGDGKTGQGKFEDLFVQKQAEQILVPGAQSSVPLEVIYEATDVPNKIIGIIRQKVYDDMGNFQGYKKIASKMMDADEAAKFKDITENVRGGGRNLSSPEELFQLYKDLKQKSSYGDYSFKSQEAQKEANSAVKEVQGLLRGGVDQLESTDAKIASLKQAASVIGMEDTVNVDKQQMMNKIIDLINQQEQLGPPGSKARQKLQEFVNVIRAEHPGLARQVESRVKDLGEQARSARTVAGLIEPGMLSTGKRVAVAGANFAGTSLHKLSKLPPEAWVQRAQQIAAQGGKASEELSKILSQLPNKNERERNAILFGLMQNPAYRQYLQSDVEEEAK